jgi:sec-independent protein translocase protein TatC
MSSENLDDSSAPLIEHLTELRNRLIKSVLAFLVGMVICFSVWQPIFNFLTQPICVALADRNQDCGLVLIKLQEGFFVAIRISLLGGLGGAFAFYVVIPLAFDFFLGFQQFGAPTVDGTTGDVSAGILFQGSMEEYLALTTKFIMAFGICFQLPVLLTLMGKAGLVSSAGLASVRKYAVVAILVLAAVVTPPDVITQVILFAVVYGLYEISILLVRRVEKKREAELRAQGLWFDDDEDADLAEDEAPVPTKKP